MGLGDGEAEAGETPREGRANPVCMHVCVCWGRKGD